MVILIELEEVVADLERAVTGVIASLHPSVPLLDPKSRQHFDLKEDYPGESRATVETILRAEGFYRTLPTMPGAVAALQGMLESGHEVFICSAPYFANVTSETDKRLWLDMVLGPEWFNRFLVSCDKTLLSGDILIDRKPWVTGLRPPSWKQIIFDRPYNGAAKGPRLLNWQDWRKILY
jgi:5'-nucleotidase